MTELRIILSHILVAFILTSFSFQLAKWTSLALIPSVVTLFLSLPILIVGMLRLYWGSYEEISPIAWICIGTMLFAAVLFGIGMLLN